MLSGLFKWISRFQVNTQYEASLIKASYPDQYPPDEDSVQDILKTFEGKNNQIRADVAVAEFFKFLENGDYKSYWTFNLKMLVLMDRSLQQKLITEEIISYHNPYLASFQAIGQSHNSILTNNFISQYYTYIKRKATIYNSPKSIFSLKSRDRLVQISKLSMQNIFQIIKISLELHSQIFKISNNYKNGDRKKYLIEYVFCNLLNTELSCYTIQSMCTSILITKIPSLDFHQLIQVKQAIEQMNKTTKQTIKFIQSNKQLQGFKDFKYGQFLTFDFRIISLLDDALKHFEQGRKFVVKDVDVEDWKQTDYHLQVSRYSLERKVFQNNNHFVPGNARKRILQSKQNKAKQMFVNFKNQYNDQFCSQTRVGSDSITVKQSSTSLGRTFSYKKPQQFDETVWKGFKSEHS